MTWGSNPEADPPMTEPRTVLLLVILVSLALVALLLVPFIFPGEGPTHR